jgi:hypothetical protein
MAQFTIPGGPSKGTPIESADEKSITYWIDRIEKDLAENPTKKFADRDAQWLEAARAELARRSAGGAPAAAPPPRQQAAAPASTALARPAPGSVAIAGSHARAEEIAAALVEAERQFHLVSPATQCGALPEGCEVVISMVSVDGRIGSDGKPLSADIYPVGMGKFGLSKAPLDRIAGAAGVDWDPVLTRRLDDARDPFYCAFQAVGYVRSFDGTRRTITGTKEMDLRDGSPQCEALASRKRDGSGDASKQIREMRLHILGHAESKAKLRAIRSLGLQTSYKPEELSRPFAIARLMFTGRTADPELRREFARMNADAMISGTRALYGAPALPAPIAAPIRPAAALDEDDYYPPEPPRQIEAHGEAKPPSAPRNSPPPVEPPPPPDWDRGPDADAY